MREGPILFSAPMVRALLAGTKSQTRRIVKPQPTHFNPAGTPRRVNPDGGPSAMVRCPYGQPGDRLWVRETWRASPQYDWAAPREVPKGSPVYYEATADDDFEANADNFDFHPSVLCRPSVFMPRWASRITLEVTGVRVERLQDISEADAIAEGIERGADFPGWYRGPLPGDSEGLAEAGRAFKVPTAFPRLAYRALWESINGPGSWDADPWVWVVAFKRVQP
ncbi:MAG: hypothetical protein IIZ92_09290 [Aquincola sp.]|nr:hypothetical protein [Aquincola sp.]